MSGAFVPKSRRPRFELQLRILDLNNVPLVSGTSFIKWHLPHSTAAEHRGKTDKCPVRDHRVVYDYEKTVAVRLTIGKDGVLQECPIDFEILQEYGTVGSGERIKLGLIKFNLAEYVEGSGQTSYNHRNSDGNVDPNGAVGIVRRYLMQDSKINSTLKIGIHMKQTEGSREFTAPALRTAPVFGGIAGIMSSAEPVVSTSVPGQNGEGEDPRDEGNLPMPSLSTSNREVGEMQDVYRQTLAAHWASLPGELRADECIEEIFAGRDGWGKVSADSRDDAHFANTEHHGSHVSAMERPRSSGVHMRGHSRHGSKSQIPNRHARTVWQGEIEESDLRADFRSWKVGEKATV